MSKGKNDSDGGCRIDAVVKGSFLAAVRRGARLQDAARGAGCSLPGLYGARKRDADFRAAWVEALEVSAGAVRIVPNNRRRLQFRKMRHVKFDEARRERFLAHFAGTCDTKAAAEAAQIDETTVYKRRKRDPQFDAAYAEALKEGYLRLEVEALRERLELQRRARKVRVPTGEAAKEFDRVMQLLARWDRRGGGIGPRVVARGRQQGMSFDEAIEALGERLRKLDIPILRLPPPEGEGEGEGE